MKNDEKITTFREATQKSESKYDTSKDYKLLYEISIKNEKMKIPCFIDFNHSDNPFKVARDIAVVSSLQGQIAVCVRGFFYNNWDKTLEEFIETCKKLKLNWIKPSVDFKNEEEK